MDRTSGHSSISTGRPSDRKSTRLNSSHTEIYTLSLHDALPISAAVGEEIGVLLVSYLFARPDGPYQRPLFHLHGSSVRSEEHTSELQSHRDLHSFPTRRSSDLGCRRRGDRSAPRLLPLRQT